MINRLEIKREDRWIFCGDDVYFFLQENAQIKEKRFLLRIYPGITLLLILGFFKLVFLYIIQKISSTNNELYDHLVFETYESHMHQNYFKFYNPDKNISYRGVNVFDKKSYTSIHWIPLTVLIKNLAANLKSFKKNVEYLPPSFFNLLLRKAMNSIAAYSYWNALFSKINICNPTTKVFTSGPYIPGCAATSASLETIYIAHGFIGKFFAMPAYSSVMVYSDEECIEYQSYLGHSKTALFPISEIKEMNQSILIFLESTDYVTPLGDISGLITFFQKKQYEIVLKAHPYNSDSKILQKLSRIYDIEVNSDHLLTGMEAIQKYKPRFTAGWTSTTACESLRSGVIPISLAERTSTDIERTIYPIAKRSLFWDHEKDAIEHATVGMKNYIAGLKLVRSR